MASIKGIVTTVWPQEDPAQTRIKVKPDSGNEQYYQLKKSHINYDAIVATALTALSTYSRVQLFHDNVDTVESLAIVQSN